MQVVFNKMYQHFGVYISTLLIADVAISKRPLLFTVWTQLRLRSHQNFYEIFTRKQFLPTSAGNAQAQLHFRDDQQRAFGISNISNGFLE